MSMNGSYSAFNNNLLAQERYKKFVEDADSKKILVENIQKKFDDWVLEWLWNPVTYLKSKDKTSGDYAFRRIRESENRPNESSLDSKAINVSEVTSLCDSFQEQIVDELTSLSAELEKLKESLGEKKLYVDGKNYELRIQEIIDKIEKEAKQYSKEFVDAVRDRAPFVHDFQVCVQKDYIRYFGNENSYGTAKYWRRARDGWDI